SFFFSSTLSLRPLLSSLFPYTTLFRSITIFGSAFLMHMNWIPEDATLMITDFMQDGGFLNFYIAGLITGSILSINSKVLIKAGTRFLIPLFFGVATAILIG